MLIQCKIIQCNKSLNSKITNTKKSNNRCLNTFNTRITSILLSNNSKDQEQNPEHRPTIRTKWNNSTRIKLIRSKMMSWKLRLWRFRYLYNNNRRRRIRMIILFRDNWLGRKKKKKLNSKYLTNRWPLLFEMVFKLQPLYRLLTAISLEHWKDAALSNW